MAEEEITKEELKESKPEEEEKPEDALE